MITTIAVMMTEQEARQIINEIRLGIFDVGKKLLELKEREGWRALGYKTWRECAQMEFGYKQSRVYQLLEAAEIERNISTIVEKPIPESHLRPLASLEPEQQREAWALAVQTAPDGKVTASHVERVVQEYKTPLAVHFSSKTDDWSTPQALFDLLNDEFNFTLDVCASEQNHKCKKYYTEEDDGLKKNWRGVCWMNPPYGDVIQAWVEKAFQSALDGATVVCLVPARTDTRWWWDFCIHGEVRFLKGRLKFNDAGSAPFPSALVVFRSNLSKKDRRVIWWDKWGNNDTNI